MRTQKLPSGNIVIMADNEDRAELADQYRDADKGYPGAEAYVLECLRDDYLDEVRPEWIGALTDAPIFAESVTIEDDGTPTIGGEIFWFPDYAVTDPYRQLANCGRVVFQQANLEN